MIDGCVAGHDCVGGVCEPFAAEGEECTLRRCEAGLRCDRFGRCAPPLENGAACTSRHDCESNWCAVDGTCATADSICAGVDALM